MTDDRQLSDVLSEFARTMLTDFPIQGILDQLVKRIVDVLPISSAGVTLIELLIEIHLGALTIIRNQGEESCELLVTRDTAIWPSGRRRLTIKSEIAATSPSAINGRFRRG